MFNERNFNELTKAIDQLPTISIRIDAKDMIGALRAMSCSYVELLINPKYLTTISLKDTNHYFTIKTRN